MVKVLGIVGSPRLGGNTETAVGEALRVLREEEGFETELIRLRDYQINPCKGCLACTRLRRCAQDDDFVSVFGRMVESDGFILGSPVYCCAPTADILALLQRASFLARTIRPFDRKVGGPIVVARRSGKNLVIAQLLMFFMYVGMIVPGSDNWNGLFGGDLGAVERDHQGLETIRRFARNLAWTLRKTTAP